MPLVSIHATSNTPCEVHPHALVSANPEYWGTVDEYKTRYWVSAADERVSVCIYKSGLARVQAETVEQIERVVEMIWGKNTTVGDGTGGSIKYLLLAYLTVDFAVDLDLIDAKFTHTGDIPSVLVKHGTAKYTIYGHGHVHFKVNPTNTDFDQVIEDAEAYIQPILEAARVPTE